MKKFLILLTVLAVALTVSAQSGPVMPTPSGGIDAVDIVPHTGTTTTHGNLTVTSNLAVGTTVLLNPTGDIGAKVNAQVSSLGNGAGTITVGGGGGTASTAITMGKGQRLVFGCGNYTVAGITFTDSTTDASGTMDLEGCSDGLTVLTLASGANRDLVTQANLAHLTGAHVTSITGNGTTAAVTCATACPHAVGDLIYIVNNSLWNVGFGVNATPVPVTVVTDSMHFSFASAISGTGTGGATGGVAGIFRPVIKNLTLDCGTNTSGHGINIYGWSGTIENVTVRNCPQDNVVTEWGIDYPAPLGNSTDMTMHVSHLVSTGSAGKGWLFRGPHDLAAKDIILNDNQDNGLYTTNFAVSTAAVDVGDGSGFHAHSISAYNNAQTLGAGQIDCEAVGCDLDGTWTDGRGDGVKLGIGGSNRLTCDGCGGGSNGVEVTGSNNVVIGIIPNSLGNGLNLNGSFSGLFDVILNYNANAIAFTSDHGANLIRASVVTSGADTLYTGVYSGTDTLQVTSSGTITTGLTQLNGVPTLAAANTFSVSAACNKFQANGSLGLVNICNSTTANPGYLEFRNSSNSRMGFIGAGAGTYLWISSDSGYPIQFTSPVGLSLGLNGSSYNFTVTGTPTAARTFSLPDANSNPVQPLASAPTGGCVGYIDSNGVQQPCGTLPQMGAIIGAGCTGSITSNSTVVMYGTPGQLASASCNSGSSFLGAAIGAHTVCNLRAYISSTAYSNTPGSGVVALYKNGSVTPLTCTIGSGASSYKCSDENAAHCVTLADMDQIVFKATSAGGTLTTGPTYTSGASACTNGTQTVTFSNNTSGINPINAVGTITVSGNVPTGAVTVTNPGAGYTVGTPPTQGTVSTCAGTATFTGGTVTADTMGTFAVTAEVR